MQTLVVGATGATGKHLVAELLKLGQLVKVIVRPTSRIPDWWNDDKRVSIIREEISGMSEAKIAEHLLDCQAVASCLGHNLTFKGIFGKPHRLVTDAVKLICKAVEINSPEMPVRFALMNTNGNRNAGERISFAERLVIGLVRVLVPPHSDNEQAARYLRDKISTDHPSIEWVAVRPDTLIDQDEVTGYEVFPSPIQSTIFGSGKTSRINVGNFMARLLVDNKLWKKWKGKMPVIYNETA